MSYARFLPSNRAVLFANLGQLITDGEKFPQIFELAADISPSCFSQSLLALTKSVLDEPDRALLDHIRESSVFLPWEVRFIKFGLATLKIAEVFARLCDYYVLVGKASRKLLYWSVGGWVLLSLLVSNLAMVHFKQVAGLEWWGILIAIFCMLCGLGVLSSIKGLQMWIAPDSAFWRQAARIPFCRSLIVTRSVHQFLLNLGMCIQSGMDLDRSLKVSSKSEPIDWLRQRYLGVAKDVASGVAISKAFVSSGILTETKIVVHPKPGEKAGALWEPGITDVVRQSFAEQLESVTWVIPFLVMLPLVLVSLVLVLV